MNSLVHLSFYRFLELPAKLASSLAELQTEIKSLCLTHQLKGTVLLSAEGINVMLSGEPASIDAFKSYAMNRFGIDPRHFKTGELSEHAFKRLLVKIRREIISVGDETIQPHLHTAPRITPAELQEWIKSGRPFVLLDTRNDYEIDVGTFRGAWHLGISHSRQFANKAQKTVSEGGLPSDRPIVTFCTGGIRCEKASAVLIKLGLDNVYQLDGGILKYLEESPGPHYFEGNCFVFDWRLAVDSALKATPRSTNPSKSFGRHITK